METVRLKSRVGPTGVTIRKQLENGRIVKREYHWNLDNSCITVMLREDWEALEDGFLDKKANLRYKDALIEL